MLDSLMSFDVRVIIILRARDDLGLQPVHSVFVAFYARLWGFQGLQATRPKSRSRASGNIQKSSSFYYPPLLLTGNHGVCSATNPHMSRTIIP